MSTSLKKSVFILVILSGFSKILGIAREVLLAYFYGTTKELDAYIVAMTIPNNIMHFIVSSAFIVGFVFIYTKLLAENKEEEAWKFASNIFNFFILLFLFLTPVSMLLSPQIVKIFAPGFSKEIFALTVKLTNIMLPSMLFFVFATLTQGVLNSYESFTIPGLKPIIFNLSIIIPMILTTKYIGIYSIAIGFLLASVFQVLVLVKPTFSKIKKYFFILNLKDENFRYFLITCFPLIVIMNANQLNVIADRMIASFLPSGSISALNYSYHIIEAIENVIGVSLATVLFPRLNYLACKDNFEEMKKIINKGITILFYASFMITFIFVFYDRSILRILFLRGSFDEFSLKITHRALFYYSFSIFFISANYVLFRVLYVLRKISTAMKIIVFCVLVNIILNIILSKFLGVGGITLATTISSLLLFLLSTRSIISELNIRPFLLSPKLILILIIQFLSFLVGWWLFSRLSNRYFVNLFCGLAVSICLIILLSEVFQIEEYKYLRDIIIDKLL